MSLLRPILVGNSWSNDPDDWHNFTVTVALSDYYNHSIGGEWLSVEDAETSKGMAANIVAYLDQHPDADSVIIQGGINDIRQDVSSTVIADALVYIVNEVKSRPNISDILIIGPGPFGASWMWNPVRQAELDAFLSWFNVYCQSEEFVCYDAYSALGHPDNPLIISDGTNGTLDYSLDGLHLNLTGAAKLAADMDQIISDLRGPTLVQIDVRPGVASNFVDTDGATSDVMRVAVLGSDGFDASQVDSSSVQFGPSGASPHIVPGDVIDTNDDGVDDLRLKFLIADTGLACQDYEDPPLEVTLTGETNGGLIQFEGTDTVTTNLCDASGCHP